MHHHLEIILPPTDDVNAAIAEIMEPFDENADAGDEGASPKNAFWDYYLIGGRWSGRKLLAAFSDERLDAFRAAMVEKKVTISGVQFGKPTLQPADQIQMVDQMWRAAFPEWTGGACPLFDHHKGNDGDICKLSDVPTGFGCSHVIIAGPNHDGTGLRATYMTSDTLWNGVMHVKTTWDETVSGALDEWTSRLDHYREEYRARVTPQPDWLVVTVDYHS